MFELMPLYWVTFTAAPEHMNVMMLIHVLELLKMWNWMKLPR